MHHTINEFTKNSLPILKPAKRIVIFAHINPDGDAIGSALAVALFLKSLNKEVSVISPNAVPENLHWLPGYELIINFAIKRNSAKDAIRQAHVFIHVDHNQLARLGDELHKIMAETDQPKLMIDHHPEPDNFATQQLSIIKASSAAELCTLFIKCYQRDAIKNKEIATCLYTGIMTDTGNFSFNSSNPETFGTVAELLESGINKDDITHAIFDNYSENRMRLMGHVLSKTMVVNHDYKTAYIVLNSNDMNEYKYEDGDSEGFVNLPFSIKGVQMSVLFIEKEDFVKLSLRSRGEIDVNWLARTYFNGGGHKNAAGGKSKQSLNETIEFFERLLVEHHDKITNSVKNA